jgi:hypothetical protein
MMFFNVNINDYDNVTICCYVTYNMIVVLSKQRLKLIVIINYNTEKDNNKMITKLVTVLKTTAKIKII